MCKQIIVAIALCCVSFLAQGQITQVLRGTVTDAGTGERLEAASILIDDEKFKGQVLSDSTGQYLFEALPIGRYNVQIQFLGYQPTIVNGLLVESGREAILDIQLKSDAMELERVVVQSSRVAAPALSMLANYQISIDETQRLPAAFFDPARVAMLLPGITQSNDQANHLSIHGYSPNQILWQLEGSEIVNPNHLSNAGTFTDRPTLAGGGVNTLSAQMLNDTRILTGSFPVPYGNVSAGVLDMYFRPGNAREYLTTLQAGLIGFDASVEGPISRKHEISFNTNIRYSFTGLLADMGVDFGGESITYSDAAVHLRWPSKQYGTFTLFGLSGNSTNEFKGLENADDRVEQKEELNIDFENQVQVLGLTHSLPFGQKNYLWKTSVVASGLEASRNSTPIDEITTLRTETDELEQSKISLNTQIRRAFGPKHALIVGTQLVNHQFELNTNALETQSGEVSGVWLAPFTQYEYLAGRWRFQSGLRYNFFSFNNTQSVDPRLALRYNLSSTWSVAASYAHTSRIQAPQLYIQAGNENLELLKSHQFALQFRATRDNGTESGFKAFYHWLYDVPVSTDTSLHFSAINHFDEYVNFQLESTGVGRIFGLDFFSRSLSKSGWYSAINMSIFRSEYRNPQGNFERGRFDIGYQANVVLGKEIRFARKSNRTRILGIYTSVISQKGLRDQPLDLAASEAANQTVFNPSLGFSEQRNGYARLDFRIYWKNNKPKYNTTVALDIQNMLSQENESFMYWDRVQQASVRERQLGLIPNLSYKIEF